VDKSQIRKLFGKTDYDVEVFRRQGFTRQKCSVCGGHFWSTVERNDCGDTSCAGGYGFIKDVDGETAPRGGLWDYKKGVKEWTSFFERNNHTNIRDYPVVARWRDDMYFTLASIADFQPWVLNGSTAPPANPLVVAQPCMRFNDLDNVGKTGRHFSMFTMGGQHAFNSKELTTGYWMDECMDYNFRFLNEVMRIPSEEITYKEDVWMGGGNFGPSLESFSKGLEIVNSVFMQYRITSEKEGAYEKMPMTAIDVGWGLERIPWFVNGTPTAYDSAFSYILPQLIKENGIEVDEDLLIRYARASGLLDVGESSNIIEARARVAGMIGTTQHQLEASLGRLEALYTVCDHTRALVFALADGALPSNVGGGYNLRNVLRRASTLCKIHSLNRGVNLVELCKAHIDYLKELYPRLEGLGGTLEDIISVELARQDETLEKGRRMVMRLAQAGKLSDTVESSNTLAELYESHGISPEMVEEILGTGFTMPSDFYLRLEERKKTAAPEMLPAKEEEGTKISETLLKEASASGTSGTKMLFYDESYDGIFEFKSSIVISLDGGKRLVLHETLFYPTSGGQEHDTGTINGVKVIDVRKEGPFIIHVLEKELDGAAAGLHVKGMVDRDRRLDLTRHHTATHIMNAALRRVLGEHVWQQGAEKTQMKARFDFTHYKPISRDELERVEREANRIVLEGLPVTIIHTPRGNAEKLFGFRIYQGGAVPESNLRIIQVVGVDVEACGGMHCNNTRDVGLIRIMSSERIQDGVCRMEFCAGRRAVDFVLERERLLGDSCTVFGVRADDLPKTCYRFFDEWKSLGKAVRILQEKSNDLMVQSILEQNRDDPELIIADELDPLVADSRNLGLLAKKTVENDTKGRTIFLRNTKGDFIVASKKYNAEVLGRKLVEALKGKSGGKGEIARGVLEGKTPTANIRIILLKITKNPQ